MNKSDILKTVKCDLENENDFVNTVGIDSENEDDNNIIIQNFSIAGDKRVEVSSMLSTLLAQREVDQRRFIALNKKNGELEVENSKLDMKLHYMKLDLANAEIKNEELQVVKKALESTTEELQVVNKALESTTKALASSHKSLVSLNSSLYKYNIAIFFMVIVRILVYFYVFYSSD